MTQDEAAAPFWAKEFVYNCRHQGSHITSHKILKGAKTRIQHLHLRGFPDADVFPFVISFVQNHPFLKTLSMHMTTSSEEIENAVRISEAAQENPNLQHVQIEFKFFDLFKLELDGEDAVSLNCLFKMAAGKMTQLKLVDFMYSNSEEFGELAEQFLEIIISAIMNQGVFLRTLMLRGVTVLKNTGLGVLLAHQHKLQYIEIYPIGDGEWQPLQLREITEGIVRGNSVTKLDIYGNITDYEAARVMSDFFRRYDHLKEIHFDGYKTYASRFVPVLCAKPSLQRISFEGCYHPVEHQNHRIENLLVQNQDLRYLHIDFAASDEMFLQDISGCLVENNNLLGFGISCVGDDEIDLSPLANALVPRNGVASLQELDIDTWVLNSASYEALSDIIKYFNLKTLKLSAKLSEADFAGLLEVCGSSSSLVTLHIEKYEDFGDPGASVLSTTLPAFFAKASIVNFSFSFEERTWNWEDVQSGNLKLQILEGLRLNPNKKFETIKLPGLFGDQLAQMQFDLDVLGICVCNRALKLVDAINRGTMASAVLPRAFEAIQDHCQHSSEPGCAASIMFECLQKRPQYLLDG